MVTLGRPRGGTEDSKHVQSGVQGEKQARNKWARLPR